MPILLTCIHYWEGLCGDHSVILSKIFQTKFCHSVGKTLAFCPFCLKYFSSVHSHSQDIRNRRWQWFGSSGAVHYVNLQPLLARQWVLLAGVVAETWLGSGAGGVLEVHDLPPDFLTWERTCDLPAGTLPWTAIPLNSSSHPGKLKKEKNLKF